jgi:hypothetical protein
LRGDIGDAGVDAVDLRFVVEPSRLEIRLRLSQRRIGGVHFVLPKRDIVPPRRVLPLEPFVNLPLMLRVAQVGLRLGDFAVGGGHVGLEDGDVLFGCG